MMIGPVGFFPGSGECEIVQTLKQKSQLLPMPVQSLALACVVSYRLCRSVSAKSYSLNGFQSFFRQGLAKRWSFDSQRE